MRVTVAMDSFKGSMTSLEAGNAVKKGILKVFPEAVVNVFPVADGGEGTVDALCFAHAGLKAENSRTQAGTCTRREIWVTGPLGEKIQASYTIIAHGAIDTTSGADEKTAIIEMASAAGLPLVPPEKRNPMATTTYGVGEMIRDAVNEGCRHFIVGIGGSATNDGGVGMLQALGCRFTDAKGLDVPFGADGLSVLSNISEEDLLPELAKCRFRIACDVDNPLLGDTGCSAIFAPQKGATPEMVRKMEEYMKHYADLTEQGASCQGKKIDRNYPGAGAAGGLGYAFLMFLNASLERGVDIILDEIGLEQEIAASDYVITGEGRLDAQTMMGKAPAGVARLARRHGKPVVAFAGMVDESAKACKAQGLFDTYYEIQRNGMDIETAMRRENAIHNLECTVALNALKGL